MTCDCTEATILATDGNGRGYLARVTYRCAQHAPAERAKRRVIARYVEDARRLTRALPAPAVPVDCEAAA